VDINNFIFKLNLTGKTFMKSRQLRQRQHIDFQPDANVFIDCIVMVDAVFGECFVRIQHSARLHVEERGFHGAVRVQMRRIKLVKNGGNDGMGGGFLVRIY
jgi:hypothetical protein